MKTSWVAACLTAAFLFGTAAEAKPVTDCPLRDAPFSTDTPLIDILNSPAAKAAVDANAPRAFKSLYPSFVSTQVPTFASILNLKEVVRNTRLSPEEMDKLDAALRKVPVTRADRVARCARYDNDRPSFSIPAGKPRLLIFEKMTGYRDGPAVEAARAALQSMASRKGWAVAITDKGGAMTPSILRQFDLVVWNNVSGDVLTKSQRKAFETYMYRGGGFVGIHSASGDFATYWDWYTDMLIGARFAGHPLNPQFQAATLKVDNPTHPVAQGLPAQWGMIDEWYSFKSNPRASGSDIIATLDETTYKPEGLKGQNLRMGDHPIAWTRCIGRGRAFYSAIGHRPEIYSDPIYVTMLENAVQWAGSRNSVCPPRGQTRQ